MLDDHLVFVEVCKTKLAWVFWSFTEDEYQQCFESCKTGEVDALLRGEGGLVVF